MITASSSKVNSFYKLFHRCMQTRAQRMSVYPKKNAKQSSQPPVSAEAAIDAARSSEMKSGSNMGVFDHYKLIWKGFNRHCWAIGALGALKWKTFEDGPVTERHTIRAVLTVLRDMKVILPSTLFLLFPGLSWVITKIWPGIQYYYPSVYMTQQWRKSERQKLVDSKPKSLERLKGFVSQSKLFPSSLSLKEYQALMQDTTAETLLNIQLPNEVSQDLAQIYDIRSRFFRLPYLLQRLNFILDDDVALSKIDLADLSIDDLEETLEERGYAIPANANQALLSKSLATHLEFSNIVRQFIFRTREHNSDEEGHGTIDLSVQEAAVTLAFFVKQVTIPFPQASSNFRGHGKRVPTFIHSYSLK